MLNIVLFGPPGAGKGTQSQKLINEYGLVHISTGDILRAEMKSQTELGLKAKNFIENGALVPDEVVIGMIEKFIDSNSDASGFIFDGFPRTIAQAEALDDLLENKKSAIDVMLSLEVPEEELRNRLLLRGKDSGRADDQNPEVIQNRIDVYNRETSPLKTYYAMQKKYRSIEGVGSIEEIFSNLCSTIDNIIEPQILQEAVLEGAQLEKELSQFEKNISASKTKSAPKAKKKASPKKKVAVKKSAVAKKKTVKSKKASKKSKSKPAKSVKKVKKKVKNNSKKKSSVKNRKAKVAVKKGKKKPFKKSGKKISAKKSAKRKTAKKSRK